MNGSIAEAADFAHFHAVPGVPGVDILHARFSRHRFDPHAHDEWAIATVIAGAQDNAIGRHSNILRTGDIGTMHPGHAHAGTGIGGEPCHYAMIYVSDTVFRERALALGIVEPRGTAAGVRDVALAGRMAAFVARVPDVAAQALLQREWPALFDDFLLNHAASDADTQAAMSAATAAAASRLRRAHRFLTEHWDQAVSLEMLAEVAALSPYHFCRRFAQEYGLSPHRFQLTLRLARAKVLIGRGARLADVAQLTGFADQSHLGRQFKGSFGFTPGRLAQQSAPP